MMYDRVWVNNGRQRLNIHGEKNNGQELNTEEHLSVLEQNQCNDYIERRSVYDRSDKMETIEGQYQ